MAILHIQCADSTETATVAEVFQRGSNGQADTRVSSQRLTASVAEVNMPDGCYVVVRAAADDPAKSIDNW